jgi:hypothetical protein
VTPQQARTPPRHLGCYPCRPRSSRRGVFDQNAEAKCGMRNPQSRESAKRGLTSAAPGGRRREHASQSWRWALGQARFEFSRSQPAPRAGEPDGRGTTPGAPRDNARAGWNGARETGEAKGVKPEHARRVTFGARGEFAFGNSQRWAFTTPAGRRRTSHRPRCSPETRETTVGGSRRPEMISAVLPVRRATHRPRSGHRHEAVVEANRRTQLISD